MLCFFFSTYAQDIELFFFFYLLLEACHIFIPCSVATKVLQLYLKQPVPDVFKPQVREEDCIHRYYDQETRLLRNQPDRILVTGAETFRVGEGITSPAIFCSDLS